MLQVSILFLKKILILACRLLTSIYSFFRWWSFSDSTSRAISDSLEPSDYFSISGTIYNISSTSCEEDFDDYFSRPDISKISHLHLEDLEIEEP